MLLVLFLTSPGIKFAFLASVFFWCVFSQSLHSLFSFFLLLFRSVSLNSVLLSSPFFNSFPSYYILFSFFLNSAHPYFFILLPSYISFPFHILFLSFLFSVLPHVYLSYFLKPCALSLSLWPSLRHPDAAFTMSGGQSDIFPPILWTTFDAQSFQNAMFIIAMQNLILSCLF